MNFITIILTALLPVTVLCLKNSFNSKQYLFPLQFTKQGEGVPVGTGYGAFQDPHPMPYPAMMGQEGYGPPAYTTTAAPAEEKEKRLFCVVGQVFVILVLLDIEVGLLLTRLIWPELYLRVLPTLMQPIAAIFLGLTDMLPFPDVVVVPPLGRAYGGDNPWGNVAVVNDDFLEMFNNSQSEHQWGRVGEVLDVAVSIRDGEECGYRVACEYSLHNPHKAKIWRLLKHILPSTYSPVFDIMKEGLSVDTCNHYTCKAFEGSDFSFLFKSGKKNAQLNK